jgi:hypothetical protein
MNARTPFRLLIAVLTFVSIGLATTTTGAAQNVAWTDTFSREDVLVQDCRGASVVSGYSPTLAYGFDFEINTSYTSDRALTYFDAHQGIDHVAMEQQSVSFVGNAVNSKTGLSLAYGGHFSRTAKSDQSEITFTDFVLHLVPSHGSAITVKVDRSSSTALDSPEVMLLAFAPQGLHTSLCGYFAGLHGAAE